MANIKMCERCGSIGRGDDFVTIRVFDESQGYAAAVDLGGNSNEAEVCKGCKSDLLVFLSNESTGTRDKAPIPARKFLTDGRQPATDKES